MSAQNACIMLAAALAIDWFWGEPPVRLHPVCWIGSLTKFVMRAAPSTGHVQQSLFGIALAVGMPCLMALMSHLSLQWLSPWPTAQVVLGTWWLTSAFAWRGLGRAGLAVRAALAQGNIGGARAALGSLCSRDATHLTPPLLVAATVESLAENASDSLVAPLLFYALGGIPAAMAYRAVNTLDAMVGYRGKYEYLGKASARLDDVLNIIPARITALLLLTAGLVCRADVRLGARMWWRDGNKTASPNAGGPMAAMAGLLCVELEKVGHYKLGAPLRELRSTTIDAAWRIVCVACLLMAFGTGLSVLSSK